MSEPIGARLRRSIKALPGALLMRTRGELRHLYGRWHAVTRGSGASAPLDVLTKLHAARNLLDEALAALKRAREHAAAYAAVVEGGGTPPARAGPAGDAEPTGESFDPLPWLPPRAPRRVRGGPYRKTRGTGMLAGAVVDLISGEHDGYSSQVNRYARELGIVRDGAGLQTAADVELKFAMRMRAEGVSEAKLLIDRPPCVGRLSCDALLPRFLPPGATLTVYWPEPTTGADDAAAQASGTAQQVERRYNQKTYRGVARG
jgi:hypothetical protein